MKRLQGKKYHSMKHRLTPIGYSETKAGNICLYYEGGFYHYLNDGEKAEFNPEGLEKRTFKNYINRINERD